MSIQLRADGATLPAPVSEADIYTACRAFILRYALPALDEANVIQGWQNRTSLPEGTNEFAVMTITHATQRGTSLEVLLDQDADAYLTATETTPTEQQPTQGSESDASEAQGALAVMGLMEVRVRLDFCGNTDTPRQRAQRLMALGNAASGVEFFRQYGLSSLYAERLREKTRRDESLQFLRRYSIALHLSCWCGDVLPTAYFTTATMARLENVDVSNPLPKE